MYESLLVAATQAKNDNVVTILLNYEIDVHKDCSLLSAMWANLRELVEFLLNWEVNAYETLYELFKINDLEYIEKTILRFVVAKINIDEIIVEKLAIC